MPGQTYYRGGVPYTSPKDQTGGRVNVHALLIDIFKRDVGINGAEPSTQHVIAIAKTMLQDVPKEQVRSRIDANAVYQARKAFRRRQETRPVEKGVTAEKVNGYVEDRQALIPPREGKGSDIAGQLEAAGRLLDACGGDAEACWKVLRAAAILRGG